VFTKQTTSKQRGQQQRLTAASGSYTELDLEALATGNQKIKMAAKESAYLLG